MTDETEIAEIDVEADELQIRYEREARQIAKQKKITDLVEGLFNELNCMGSEEEIGKCLVEAVQRQHRTLQQVFFGRCIKPLVLDFANRYKQGWYDARNEASCKVATEMKPILEKAYFPFI